jgi:UDPglucose--hexose-1-phosphate uridylyltransferase
MFTLNAVSHRRLNPLTGEWVLVSPHRTARPWQGQVETAASARLPAYDPDCYLCPGNVRAGGIRNPQYSSTFVFDNDFAALQHDVPADLNSCNVDDLLVASPEKGICRVGCFSPRHDLSLPGMSVAEIETVIEMWTHQFKELSSIDFIRHIQIFENRGAMMGASNPHPHCQIWGSESIPNEPAKEQRSFLNYHERHKSCLLCQYAEHELASERLIFSGDEFAVVVPFWAVWPFETMIIPRRHIADITELDSSARRELAGALQKLTRCYDQIFQAPFPYSMGFHQRPVNGEEHPEWHMHAHFYPPLLRSATIRKFMVGFEMLGSPQRDLTPESAAERIRALCQSLP